LQALHAKNLASPPQLKTPENKKAAKFGGFFD
jgi:hypothetical protein